MRYIHKIFHEKSREEFDYTYNERFNYDSSIKLGLFIKPINQPHSYELYYVPTNKMLDLVGKIYTISKDFDKLFNSLPGVVRNQFIDESIAEELQNTNELEGVRSSREEIVRSAKIVRKNKESKTRFGSMIKSYVRLLNQEIEIPKEPQEIRTIYDEIIEGEIESDHLPDGKIFRKEITEVLKKSGSEKVIHRGIMPENAVIQAVQNLLDFMAAENDIPELLKVAIGHYYFGYIHPFYDGNGRTSRYISSIYLSKALGVISALSLSRASNKYKHKYLESFEYTNSIKSRGEMNGFIEQFLQMIADVLLQMYGELKEKHELMEMANLKISKEEKLKETKQIVKDVMWILAQNRFFSSDDGLTTKELAGICKKSEVTIRDAARQLFEWSLIEKIGDRPVIYRISPSYFEE